VHLGSVGDQQLVVADALPVPHGGSVAVGLDRLKPVCPVGRPVALGDLREVEAQRLADAERLGHRQRQIDEVAARSMDLDRDPIAQQLAQGQQRLEGRHASSRDQHVRLGVLGHRLASSRSGCGRSPILHIATV
jgi:hypothetical protein